MLQNVAAHNVRVPKRKVFKTYTSHNVQRNKTYTITKRKVHITQALQNVCMFCDAVRYMTFTLCDVHFLILLCFVSLRCVQLRYVTYTSCNVYVVCIYVM
jgi:hypothetical protein